MINVIVTYKVKADRVAENEELVHNVYAGLADLGAPNVHYATFKKEDGQTFVHIAFFSSPEDQAVLSNLPAFQAFQKDIADRCEVPPNPEPLTPIGAHNLSYPPD